MPFIDVFISSWTTYMFYSQLVLTRLLFLIAVSILLCGEVNAFTSVCKMTEKWQGQLYFNKQ